MSFSAAPRPLRLLARIALMLACALAGCHRHVSVEEKNLRAQLKIALRDGAYDQAVELARGVLRSAPQDNGAWERLAAAQFGSDDLTGVKETLESWRGKISRPSPKFDEYRGDVALAEGDPAAALPAWMKSLAARPRNARVWEKVAQLDQRERHWAEAVTAWTRLLKLQETAGSLLQRTDCLRHLHDWDAALRDFARARELAPGDAEVGRWTRGSDRLKEFIPQLKELDRQLEVASPDAGLLSDRALILLRADVPDVALEDAEAAAKIAAHLMRPRLFRGLALIALGRVAEAEKIPVRKSLRLDSLSPEFLETMSRLDAQILSDSRNAVFYIARAWQLNEIGQPALALEDAETASQLDRKSAGACAEASYALTKLDRAQDAYDRIKRATELDPTFSTAWLYRGELEMRRVDYLTAIESFTHALALSETVAALQKRESCYRKVGLALKAAQDHDAAAQLSAPSVK